MRLSELFQDPLTQKRHEIDDIHYIGEALPAPSLAVSVLSSGTPSFVGGSPIPAREDHVHQLDVDDLIDAINALPDPPEIDLGNYYTKDEVDALLESIDLSDYYTKTEMDATINIIYSGIVNVANAVTAVQGEVDDVEDDIVDLWAALGSVSGGPNDHTWSYIDEVVDPTGSVYSDCYFVSADATILELWVSVVSAQSGSDDFIITLWVDGGNEGSVILAGGTDFISSGVLSVSAASTDTIRISVAKDGSFTGDAENLSVGIVYEYA